jgi:hypothetical protein
MLVAVKYCVLAAAASTFTVAFAVDAVLTGVAIGIVARGGTSSIASSRFAILGLAPSSSCLK